MPSRAGGGGPTLRQGLDKEVYQIVRKLQDELPGSATSISVHAVYDWIRRSNSSLKRKPKQLLEDSIERVLGVMQEEQEESEGEELGSMQDGFFNALTPVAVVADASNAMNRSIRSSLAPSGPATPTASGDTQRRKAGEHPQPNGITGGQPLKRRDGQHSSEPARKRPRVKEEVDTSPPIHPRLEDLGGVDSVIEQMEEHLVLPLLSPEDYVERKLSIPRGILLHGPPGCGKTMISRAWAAVLGVPFIEILGPSVVSGMSGESEKQIRELFEKAKQSAPCLLFIDEIDVIAPKRETSQSQMEKRIVAQLLISMDSLAMEGNEGKPVIVLAATNRPDSIDPALRRGGRFGTEINMGVPNELMREHILRAQMRETQVSEDVDFARLAKMTPGFVGADLKDLVDKAGAWSMARYREALKRQAADDEASTDVDSGPDRPRTSDAVRSALRLVRRVRDKQREKPPGFENPTISMEAFLAVIPGVQPSSKREGFATIPDTTWEDIGALREVRDELHTAIVEPIISPERYKRVGITAPTGVLLWGPPGCGKTLLAKAVANESKANFISVKGPELLNKVRRITNIDHRRDSYKWPHTTGFPKR